jgi:glucose-6-phosphate isomerase
MINIKLDINRTAGFINKDEISSFQEEINEKHAQLINKTGKGNDFLGWVDLPSSITSEFLDQIKADADKLAAKADVFVVIGIGGSYLGARAVIEALQHQFSFLIPGNTPKIVYAGS